MGTGTLANIADTDERYRLEADQPVAIAEALAPRGSEPASVVQFVGDLTGCLEWDGNGGSCECTIQTAVLVAVPGAPASR